MDPIADAEQADVLHVHGVFIGVRRTPTARFGVCLPLAKSVWVERPTPIRGLWPPPGAQTKVWVSPRMS